MVLLTVLLSWVKICHYIVKVLKNKSEDKSFDKGMSATSTVAIKISIFFLLSSCNFQLETSTVGFESTLFGFVNNDTHQNDTHQNDTHQNDTHQNDTHQNDTHQNDTHQNDTHQNDTHQNDTQHNDIQQNDSQVNGASIRALRIMTVSITMAKFDTQYIIILSTIHAGHHN
jgi:hypothetical protein